MSIRYYGQYVALAVADTFEAAKAAADAVRVTYATEKPNVATELTAEGEPEVGDDRRQKGQSERGDADGAFDAAPVRLDQTYVTPSETHNPIELHATTAVWDGPMLTLYESTQGVDNTRDVVAQMLGVPTEQVRVDLEVSRLRFRRQALAVVALLLAAAAARQLGRPVKLVLRRKMMFQTVGHRPRTVQRVRLGATRDGKLSSLQHDIVNHTRDDRRLQGELRRGDAVPVQRAEPARHLGLARRHVGSTSHARAGRGARPLRHRVGDERARRRARHRPDASSASGTSRRSTRGWALPFSSRHLLECFSLGAERFGWSGGNPRSAPCSATVSRSAGAWPAARGSRPASRPRRASSCATTARRASPAGRRTSARARTRSWRSCVAEKTGLPLDKIEVVLGDTALPAGPISGGSMVTGSMVPAVFAAADARDRIVARDGDDAPGSPFEKRRSDELAFTDGRVFVKKDGAGGGIPFGEVLRRANVRDVAAAARSRARSGNSDKPKVSTHSFGGHFVEVTWQPAIARLRVNRVVTVIDAGRILNPLAGRNQIEGAVVMGIGMALFEETVYDPRNGAPINSNLADYVVAVNADVAARSRCTSSTTPTRRSTSSARAASARSAWPAWRRRSPPRSTTRRACAYASCRSRSRTCWLRAERRLTIRDADGGRRRQLGIPTEVDTSAWSGLSPAALDPANGGSSNGRTANSDSASLGCKS